MQCSIENGIAILTINNPPVNALSGEERDAIRAAFERLEKDPDVKAVVLTGTGRVFVAGGDIADFVKVTSGFMPRVPALLRLIDWIENFPKPVVAAVNGLALGGGLELAMGAHYRLAVPDAQVGQPEVNLGLIPGGGGTQRLPRLAGVQKALQMCTDGNPIKVDEAIQLGLIDKLVDSDLVSVAVAFARDVVGKPAPKTRERDQKLGKHEQNSAMFAACEGQHHGLNSALPRLLWPPLMQLRLPPKCPLRMVAKLNRRSSRNACFPDESKALIHVFLAERELGKIPDIPKEMATIPVNHVAVVGAGTMGSGIAMAFANAGIPVLIKDLDQAALDRGLSNIQKNYATSVKRGRFTQQFVDERLKLIEPTLSYDDFANVDMVVEAVFREWRFKKEVLPNSIACARRRDLATTRRYLNVDEIASATKRPEAVLGMHLLSVPQM